jgi:hypothetical protein
MKYIIRELPHAFSATKKFHGQEFEGSLVDARAEAEKTREHYFSTLVVEIPDGHRVSIKLPNHPWMANAPHEPMP